MEATCAVWHVITWHLENGRALQLLKSIPHLYRNDCGVDIRGGTPSTSSSLLSRQFGLMSVSQMYRAVCNFCHFHCIAHSLVHDLFPLSHRCTRFFESKILFKTLFFNWDNSSCSFNSDLFFNCALTHTQHNIMFCFHSWVAETMVNLELNNSSKKGREPLDYHARGIGNDWNLHEHFLLC